MSIFTAQKIYLMGLNRSPLVNVFSSKILASVAGGAPRAARAAGGSVQIFTILVHVSKLFPWLGAWLGAWERGSVAGSVSFCTRLVKYS